MIRVCPFDFSFSPVVSSRIPAAREVHATVNDHQREHFLTAKFQGCVYVQSYLVGEFNKGNI